MAVAIVSNLKNRVVPHDMVILGEVGLTGNVRSIPRDVYKRQVLAWHTLKEALKK